MSFNWKQKMIGMGLVTLFAIYLLIPTLIGYKDILESYRNSGATLPWYYKFLPQQQLNLGLDLQGGLYMELDVDVKEAVHHELGLKATDISKTIFAGEEQNAEVVALPNNLIRVKVDASAVRDLQSDLVRYYGNSVFDLVTDKHELFFEIKSNPEDARKNVISALQGLEGEQTNVDFSHEKQLLAVTFSDSDQREKILKTLSEPQFANSIANATGRINDVVYLKFKDSFIKLTTKNILNQAASSVSNRIDRYGVSESGVSFANDRLAVELPGIKDPERVIEVIRRTGKLEFRIVDKTIPQAKLEELVSAKLSTLQQEKMYEKEWVEKLNVALAAELPPNTEILFELQRSAVTKKVIKATPLLLEKTAKVTGDMLSNASVQVENNKPYVSMSFNEMGTKAFGDVTSANVGKNLAIILDGIVESAPEIQTAITDGNAQITLHRGGYQELHDEASALVLILKEGALPASLTVASKNIIGPSLGRDSIHAGLKSLWIAALVVAAFMMVYYRWGGLIANLALLLNVVYIFAALSLCKASLTLPGMAGIVLTMGMAVDANVIIFERMREERHLGQPSATIVASGYQHAMSAIIDGNLTTLIAGVVLFQFGTGPIKGFAVTLMIGILSTMLTAIVYTRTFYEWMLQSLNVKKLSF